MHQEIDEDFTDDSSAALGLSHGVHYAAGYVPDSEKSLEREERKRLRDELESQGVKDIGMLEPSNKGAHAGLDRRTRELQSQGLCLVESTARATEELREGRLDAAPPRDSDDPIAVDDPDHIADDRINGEQLMKKRIAIKGGSSNSRRMKEQKPGMKAGPGRPTIDDEPRSQRRTIYITPTVEDAIASVGSINDVMSAVGRAILTGKPFDPKQIGVLSQQGSCGKISAEAESVNTASEIDQETAT